MDNKKADDISDEDYTYSPVTPASAEIESLRQELMAYRVLLTGAMLEKFAGIQPVSPTQYGDYLQGLMYAGIYGGGFCECGVEADAINRVCAQLHLPPMYKEEAPRG